MSRTSFEMGQFTNVEGFPGIAFDLVLNTMSATTTVDIDSKLLNTLRDFRLSKRSSKNAALVAKIDKKKLLLEEEELLDPITPDELAEELPEHSPRFVVLSYELHHQDGRISYVCP